MADPFQSTREAELWAKLEQNQAHRRQRLDLENKLLEIRLERSRLLKEHYEEHWLKVELRGYESKMESLVGRSKYTVYQTVRRRIDDFRKELAGLEACLDNQIAELQQRLDGYKRLDRNLLSEYRGLREDLDCQNLLIEMSGGNVDKLLESS